MELEVCGVQRVRHGRLAVAAWSPAVASAGTLERGRRERPWATSGKSQLSTNAPSGELTMFVASLGAVGVKSRRFFFPLSAGVESKVLADARCDVEVRKY